MFHVSKDMLISVKKKKKTNKLFLHLFILVCVREDGRDVAVGRTQLSRSMGWGSKDYTQILKLDS